MRPKSLLLLLLALGCGLVASIGISQVMDRKPEQPAAAAPDMQPVVVATADVPFGTSLSESNVKVEDWPKEKVAGMKGVFAKVEDLDGRRAKQTLVSGLPIVEAVLIGKDGYGGPVDLIPEGYRVVPVKVETGSGANLIQPGDRVDVMVYVKEGSAPGIDQTFTTTLLRNVKVFAVGDIYRRPEDKQDDRTKAATVSLLVTSEQAQQVTLATELGKIKLVMRNASDASDKEEDNGRMSKIGDIFRSGGVNDPHKELGKSEDKKPGGILQVIQGEVDKGKTPVAATIAPADAPFKMAILSGAGQVQIFTFPDPKQLPTELETGAGPAEPAAKSDAAAGKGKSPDKPDAPTPDPPDGDDGKGDASGTKKDKTSKE